ncbi:cytochrome b [Aliirhizobium terrae]|uniref:cytochrome b n=1 Tax=Terrirhizobium terrae TaxID=2926709 RepID=UPI0025775075|nr:cytochrome b [Rhizobium sp. CC-CFT758]WJH39177.1 cytochrome b [Rhizobium sp. CC-CFT758]
MKHAADRYDAVTIILHWLIALLILGQICLGFVMARLPIDPGLQFSLFQWHKSFGLLALLLASIRLVHSFIWVRSTPAKGVSRIEYGIARTMHYLLILLAVCIPVAGWMIVSVSPLEIPTFVFNLFVMPHLPVAKSDAAEALWTSVHTCLAYTLLVLVLIHSAAALYHHYRRRDEVLTRMLGIRPRPARTTIGDY